MAKNESKRLKPKILEADVSALSAVVAVVGYAPAHTKYKPYALKTAREAMRSARSAEAHAEALHRAARDRATAAEWAFHNLILGTKEQVIAQFGRDSDEVEALGLKKKSDYGSAKPKRR